MNVVLFLIIDYFWRRKIYSFVVRIKILVSITQSWDLG